MNLSLNIAESPYQKAFSAAVSKFSPIKDSPYKKPVSFSPGSAGQFLRRHQPKEGVVRRLEFRDKPQISLFDVTKIFQIRLKKLDAQNKLIQQQVGEFRVELNQLNRTNESLKQNLTSVNEENERLVTESNRLGEANKSQAEQIDAFKAEKENLIMQNSDLQLRLSLAQESLESSHGAARTKIEELETSKKQLEEQVKQLKKVHKDAEDARVRSTTLAESLKAEKEKLQSANSTATDDKSKLEDELILAKFQRNVLGIMIAVTVLFGIYHSSYSHQR